MRRRRIPWRCFILSALWIAVEGLTAAACAQDSVPATEVKWRGDYSHARREALEKGLPLVIDFGTKSCRYCVLLDQTTFRDPKVVGVMNERFVPLKIDADVDVKLASDLRISSYPTIVLASPDGTIVSTVVGYKDSGDFHEVLQRALATVASPDWMQRDLQLAAQCIQKGQYARAVSTLKSIAEEGKGRPVQGSAEKLLAQLEQLAGQRLVRAREMQARGQVPEAVETVTETIRLFPGLDATKEAADLLSRLVQNSEIRQQQRSKRARELLAQATDFYKNREHVPCLDRCEVLVGSYGDLEEGQEASGILGEIKNNPEWLQSAADVMSDRLGALYLSLADALLKKAQPQQAETYLQRVIQAFPGSRQAESAQIRLSQLQGVPARKADIQSAGP
jgi:thioredoxin-like negative regulator of GroEL